ncbi:MAG: hypothetical protein P4M01_09275 [Acidobacteriota bacterium]|nr:hypothetical protein [Acidobacteriota bacterium]
MRRILIALLVALCAMPAAALDRSALAFTRYDLHATLDPHLHGLAVEGTVVVRNRSQQPQSEAVLQISSSLHWAAVHVNGQEVEWLQQTYTTDIDHTGYLTEAIVKLPQPLPPGESATVAVRYSGVVMKDATRLTRIGTPDAAALRSDWDEISDRFTALRGLGFVTWYPVSMEAASLQHGDELFETLREWRERERDAILKIRVARLPLDEDDHTRYLLVLNQDSAKPGAEAEAEYRGEDPVVVMLEDPGVSDDRPWVNAYYTLDRTNYARDYMTAAEKAIPKLETWFGTPHRKVVLVELTDPNALPYDAGTYYFAPMRQVAPEGAEVALARPVAHTMIESPRLWIREGLAGFAQALVREHQGGRKAALAYLAQFSSALQVAEAQSQSKPAASAKDAAKDPAKQDDAEQAPEGLMSIGPQPLMTTADEVFFRTKAAYVWWMLRDRLGDHTLQAALSHYRAAEDHDSGYVQRLIEAQLPKGQNMEAFFDDWVYRDKGLPRLKIASVNVRKTLGEQTVTAITVENLGGAACEVPVALRSGNAESTGKVALPAHGRGILRLSLDSMPLEMDVNDGSVPEAEPRSYRIAITAPEGEKK